ncbi:hypothetical protein PPERSA_07251 [Pseudocohnilembus persalinus]|uniref:Uncharacterized protein n=1 Tax=Pseudocohnilembus persalinus TaxID=266149 RepID=A0A0V0QCW8_PSEPJ|nr:hypothetical protein PPERSA_07251 [Pseudocohnilembus persalinus]|eukprot:KRX00054.1 hypothetical protein PPERSA_07251 [Pseudocohnilembus persalinus]
MNQLQIWKNTCLTCKKTVYNFGKTECPICSQNLQSKLIYKNPIQNPRKNSIIITTSNKKLDPISYSQTDILHIGISDSKNNITHFWNQYKTDYNLEQNKFWENSISIPIKPEENLENLENLENFNNNVNNLDDEDFDQILQISLQFQKQNYPRYHQFNNNCFDFVARFLSEIQFQQQFFWSKENLAESVIKPHIKQLEKFCQIYKIFNQNQNNPNFYLIGENLNEQNITIVCDLCENLCKNNNNNRFKCKTCDDYDLCTRCFQNFGSQHQHQFEKL